MTLNEILLKSLNRTYEQLNNAGKLVPKARLAEYYETFKQNFGPEQLKRLDGEALLEKIHDHSSVNRDSLVYWLEFKDDEELPGIFGSIAGGSALKFGIYKRKETGVWMTGSPQKQQELSIEEAVEYARKHRDQLLRGVAILEELPPNATDEDYRILQQHMATEAPDVSDMAWGHKYFYMLYPDKLIDFHVPHYQRFYLYKLQQIPPQGEGRYLTDGRFIAAANKLGMPGKHLTAVLGHLFGRPHRYWHFAVSGNGQLERSWELMKEGNYIALGYPEIGDLSGHEYRQESKDKIKQLMQEKYYPESDQAGKKGLGLFRLVAVVEDRSIVAVTDAGKVLGIGRVTGPYYHEAGTKLPHRRPVEWLSLDEWRMPSPMAIETTLLVIGDARNIVAIEERIHDAVPVTRKPVAHQLSGLPGRIQSVLDRKGQVILYGPPGTGKTYWAEIAARELAARRSFHKEFAALEEKEKAFILGDDNFNGLVRMCTFHPNYGYEDFIEGYKAEKENDQLVFVLKDGIFKRLCRDAAAWTEHQFYLIIDEINRGDIPRIFGELLTVLELNKRKKPILLPFSGDRFSLPDNIRILGTMNTADRSIALLDTALRRRFGFIEVMPDAAVLEDKVIEGIPLGQWLDSLNRRICEYVGRDARNLQIGHSYLLEGEKPLADFNRFARVVHDDIIPLLEEYCYEDYESLEKILGNKLVDAVNQVIRHELFEPDRRDDLVEALRAIEPELLTSLQATASDAGDAEDESPED